MWLFHADESFLDSPEQRFGPGNVVIRREDRNARIWLAGPNLGEG